MRGCKKRTARVSVTSRELMRIISPRTPRNSGTALRTQALGQGGQRDARIEMAFGHEEQPLAEAPCEIRLKLGDARFVHWRMRLGPRREAVDLARVARRRDDQRAFARHAGRAYVPPVDRALAKLDNALRRAFALAERSQHSARKP